MSEIYFKEPLIEMSFWSRFFVRLTISVWNIILFVAAIVFMLSAQKFVFWIGFLLVLYLLDRFMHIGRARRSIFHIPAHGRVNISKYISPKSRVILIAAHDKALITKSNFNICLLDTLLKESDIIKVFERLDVDLDGLEAALKEIIHKPSVITREKMGEDLKIIISESFNVALDGRSSAIIPADILGALGRVNDPELVRIFGLFDIDKGDLERAAIFSRVARSFIFRIPRRIMGFGGRYRRSRLVNRAWTSRPTPNFDMFGYDLTERARNGEGGLMIGHNNEYERLLNVLTRAVAPNAMLIGEPGVGKENIIYNLAHRITKDRVPPQLFDKRLLALDVGKLLSGAEDADLQSRIQLIFKELYQAGNVILYIPNIHNLAKNAGPGKINALTAMSQFLARNDFPIIATTFPREYKDYILPDSGLSQMFESIQVGEVSTDDAARILIYEAIILENQGRLKITYGAIKKAVELATRYFHNEPLPLSAVNLLKEGVASAVRRGDKLVSHDDVISVAQMRSNIPLQTAGKEEAAKLLNLEEIIRKKLVGQTGAIAAVSEALRQYRTGLGRKGGPIGSFLFVGPTGVGKTELSKILARVQFGSEEAMIRFDMSEYQDKQSFFQFIGSPDGKVSGILTDRIYEKPYSLILLDEFEKAHPDILNLFLQVFDDGRLTDNLGRVVNFENTIIIATSNAYSEFIKSELEGGKAMEEVSAELKKKLTSIFKPELLNRFSGIIVFKNLSEEDILQIARMQLNSFSDGVKEAQGIFINFTDDAIRKVAQLGYDPIFGARPLRQVMAQKIKDPLSKMILSGDASRGSKVQVDIAGDEIKLTKIE